jgi:subtilisin-like proprotein convertase family protein
MQNNGEPGLAGQTVYLDQNHDGVRDADPTTVAAQDAPKAIPEQGTITSRLFASGIVGPITKITVSLNITHTHDADLELDLFSPHNTRDVLVLHRGGSGQNFTGTILDDQAATPIAAGTAPFGNSYQPEKPLATFAGQNPNGVWTLRITDGNLFDSGTLNGWSINFSTVEPAVQTDASGNFSFVGLAPGTYTVRMVLPPGRTQTTANPADIPPLSGANVTGLTFGSKATGLGSVNLAALQTGSAGAQALPLPASDKKSERPGAGRFIYWDAGQKHAASIAPHHNRVHHRATEDTENY